jgi:O-antigen/teichoic acid export membrane protein
MVSVFAKDIMTVLTVPAYYDAAHMVVFLVPAILLSNMYIFAPGTAIEKKTHIILWINVGGALLNVMLNAAMIPYFGIEGASVAKLLSHGMVFGAYMWFSQKLYRVPHEWKSLAYATLIIGVIAYWLPRAELSSEAGIATNFAGLAVGTLIIIKLRLIKLSELLKFIEMAQKRFYTQES